jgi:WXG100 family type VII secretion target
MPDGYKVSGPDLHKAHLDTLTVRDHSQGHINNLRNQLGHLEGVWKGEASAAFHQLFERFNTASNKVLQDLQQISDSLETAAKKYGFNEETQKASLNKIGGGDFKF